MTHLQNLAGSRWHGTSELWLDPNGNSASLSDCTVSIDGSTIRYSWSHEGKEHTGTYAVTESGATFTDSFHSAEPMSCPRCRSSWRSFFGARDLRGG